MFIVFGSRQLEKDLGVYQQPANCQHCNNTIYYNLKSSWQWFTLFWIPVFPISTKRYYSMCPICGYGYRHTKEEVEAMLGAAQQTDSEIIDSQVEEVQNESE